MGYLLAIVGILIVLAILFAFLPRLSGSSASTRSDPHAEKEQMDEPQEEFVDDAANASRSPGDDPKS